MPHKICTVCKEYLNVFQTDWHYLDIQGPFACSKECVIAWIKNDKNKHLGKSALTKVLLNMQKTRFLEFKSDYEKHFAAAMDHLHLRYAYEPYVFLVGEKYSIPDFYFIDYHCFVEVKGMWGIGSKRKLGRFRNEFPDVPLLVIPWILKDEFYPEENNG